MVMSPGFSSALTKLVEGQLQVLLNSYAQQSCSRAWAPVQEPTYGILGNFSVPQVLICARGILVFPTLQGIMRIT